MAHSQTHFCLHSRTRPQTLTGVLMGGQRQTAVRVNVNASALRPTGRAHSTRRVRVAAVMGGLCGFSQSVQSETRPVLLWMCLSSVVSVELMHLMHLEHLERGFECPCRTLSTRVTAGLTLSLSLSATFHS